jgi:hypothetical protein
MAYQSKKNKQKKNQSKPELSGEALMADALRRILNISGKSIASISSNTFDQQIIQNNSAKLKLTTDLPQKEEKTPSGIPTLNDEGVIVSSQRDYVDLKIGKEILNFETKLIREISDGKSSIQRWGIGLIIAAIFAASATMVTMQLFSTQQLKDFISTNFTEKFERAINETNTNVMLLEEEQKSLKKTVEGLKNTTKKNKQ